MSASGHKFQQLRNKTAFLFYMMQLFIQKYINTYIYIYIYAHTHTHVSVALDPPY